MAQNPNGMSQLDQPQVIKRVFDPDNDALRVIGDITVSEQAIGIPGDPVPANSKVVAGEDDSGNVQNVHVDSSGNVQVDVLSSALPTGAATEATLSNLNSKSPGSLVPTAFDEVNLTYVTVGNGIGQTETAIYKLSGSTVRTLTFSYDVNDKLSSVVAS